MRWWILGVLFGPGLEEEPQLDQALVALRSLVFREVLARLLDLLAESVFLLALEADELLTGGGQFLRHLRIEFQETFQFLGGVFPGHARMIP